MGCNCNNCDCESGITLPNQIVNATVNASDQIVFTLNDNSTIITNALTLSNSNILSNDMTSELTQSATFAQIGSKTYTIAADQMSTNGDKIVLTANVYNDVAASSLGVSDGYVKIYIGGAWYTSKFPDGFQLSLETHEYGLIEVHMSRISTTSLFVDTRFHIKGNPSYMTAYEGGFTDTVAVADLSANSLTVAVYGKSANGSGSTGTHCDQFTVEYFKKV